MPPFKTLLLLLSVVVRFCSVLLTSSFIPLSSLYHLQHTASKYKFRNEISVWVVCCVRAHNESTKNMFAVKWLLLFWMLCAMLYTLRSHQNDVIFFFFPCSFWYSLFFFVSVEFFLLLVSATLIPFDSTMWPIQMHKKKKELNFYFQNLKIIEIKMEQHSKSIAWQQIIYLLWKIVQYIRYLYI